MAWAMLTDQPVPLDTPEQQMEHFCLESIEWDRPGGKSLRSLWQENREVILESWQAEYPGTRPSLWWKWDAPEPRGSEGQTAYLERHGLLTAGERRGKGSAR